MSPDQARYSYLIADKYDMRSIQALIANDTLPRSLAWIWDGNTTEYELTASQ
jgi:hypothetical protein